MKKYVFCFGKSLKITIRLILTFCVVFNSLCFSGCFKVVSTSPYPLYSVVIDAGHGGIDAGVLGVATGVKESDINLAIARLLAISFENAGFKVTLTRNSEAGLYGTIKKGFKKRDMQKRAEIIKGANPTLLISIHQNKYHVQSRRGAQVFYQKGEIVSKQFAFKIQESLNNFNKEVRTCQIIGGDFFILKVASCPSIIVECGFLSNPEDEKLLLSSSYRENLANCILQGALNYLVTV